MEKTMTADDVSAASEPDRDTLAPQPSQERGKVLPFTTPLSRAPRITRRERLDPAKCSLTQPEYSIVQLHRAEQSDLFEELLDHASERTREILEAPGAAARLRQLGPDNVSGIQRLEASPLVQSQLIAIGLRLAGSRNTPDRTRDSLESYFARPSSSLEIEAQRRSIFKINGNASAPTAEAEAATWQVEQWIRERGGNALVQLPRWAALYEDLWCDPRIAAGAHTRRVMLAMVSLMHERAASRPAVRYAAER
jgi:hypothetical protein